MHVHDFCAGLWEARERGELPAPAAISRGLALAVAASVEACEQYEPHGDLRVVWAQAMVKGRIWQKSESRPEARPEVEATTAYLLGKSFPRELSGKELAAGEGIEELSVVGCRLSVKSRSADGPRTTDNGQLSTSPIQ